MTYNQTDAKMVFLSTARSGEESSPHSTETIFLISIFAGVASLLTVVGNVVVILSFFVNKTLRNFSNYMILSLAFSDLTIGAFSMNVYTTYNVRNRWILGPEMCKAWLSVDYTASNASVMNLLVICVDRYLAITKPVKYKRWCTPTNAALAIILVWTISFVMWVPAITLWETFSPNSTLSPGYCYIPFINDSPVLSVLTIVLAFYLPALVMCLLYNRVIHKISQRPSGIRSIIRDASSKPSTMSSKKVRFNCLKRKRNSVPEDEIAKASASGSNRTLLENAKNLANSKSRPLNSNKLLTISEPELCRNNLPSSSATKSPVSYSKNANINELRPNGKATSVDSSKTGQYKPRYKSRHFSSTTDQEHHYEKKQRPVSSSISSQKTKNKPAERSKRNSRAYREYRVTVMLKVILLCFILLWLPYSLIVVIAASCESCIPDDAWNVSYWLCYLNSTVNPFCYGFCNENFRRTFKAILTTRWWTKKSRKILRIGRKNLNPSSRHSSTSNQR